MNKFVTVSFDWRGCVHIEIAMLNVDTTSFSNNGDKSSRKFEIKQQSFFFKKKRTIKKKVLRLPSLRPSLHSLTP